MTLIVRDLVQEFSGFGSRFHLGPVNAEFNAGEVVGVLGKNGAGKSTLFNLLTGTSDAVSGDVLLVGKKLRTDTPELKRLIGYLPQHHVLPPWSTPVEILDYAATLLAVEKNGLSEVLAYWDLTEFKSKPLQTLSYGTQKRVALAVATFAAPPVAILDEPFSGLDIYHIRALEIELKRRKDLGLISLVSTHIVSQTASLCDRVLIVKDGNLKELSPWTQIGYEGRTELILKEFF